MSSNDSFDEETTIETDFLPYCNYPEVSKSRRSYGLDTEQLQGSILSSSESSNLDADFTVSFSLPIYIRQNEIPKSLVNYLKSSASPDDGTNFIEEEAIYELTDIDQGPSTEKLVEDSLPKGICNKFIIDPNGWIKNASDSDPWNEANYYQNEREDMTKQHDGILTEEMVSTGTSKLDQLPDSKAFVLTRLHLNKKGLEDISVLSKYKYFQYIDVSWNYLMSLEALRNCNYLMYLNASHNKLSKVLDLAPPWFLTHANLSCNQIKTIDENLSDFWSLRYLDLSYNLIEKIEGLHNLKYLRVLNLSHNHIRKLENLYCSKIDELYLQYNNITECSEGLGLQVLNLKILDLSNNNISSLLPFQIMYTLKRLDLSNNCVTELYELDNLAGINQLCELSMVGNAVHTSTGYRQFVIYVLPSVRVLDRQPVCCSERVAAKALFGPDVFTRTQHLRTKIELWNQLADQVIASDTVPCDQAPVPLVVLVGTFATNRDEIAEKLTQKYPNQVYRLKKHTTMPQERNYDPDNFVSVSMDKFNNMIKTGQFVVYYKEIGYFFGLCRDEICTCILDSKIGVIDIILEAALVLRASGLQPFMVLCVTNEGSLEKYAETLRNKFMDMNLWNNFRPVVSDILNSELKCTTSLRKTNEEHLPYMNLNQEYSEKSNTSESLEIIEKFEQCALGTTIVWTDFCVEGNNENLESTETAGYSKDNVTDDFIWSWSLESSVTTVQPEPDEDYVNLIQGRERFVISTLQQQELYVQTHHFRPGLFTETVRSDNIDAAVKVLAQKCCNILSNRQNQDHIEYLADNSICTKFIDSRIKYLMNDLLNIPL